MRRFRDAYLKGTEDNELNTLMAEAEWMMRTGHTSADWEELPLADADLLITHYLFSRAAMEESFKRGYQKAFSEGKKKGGK